MVSLLPTLLLLLAPTVNGFSTKIPRFSSAVAAARHTPVVSLVGATFDPLEAYEKVALTRAVRNATYASQIASNATAAWVVIKADFAPDLDKLSDIFRRLVSKSFGRWQNQMRRTNVRSMFQHLFVQQPFIVIWRC